LQLAFLNDFFLLSVGYKQKIATESAIVDFQRMNIQNLEGIGILSAFRRKAGQIHWPIRHAEARPEVL
jgi:hypothetical protein